ncbi:MULTISPECIES: anti-virulence regulator CigR family protein [Halomonas]|uniref:Nickel/cobalt transporter regulator n=1 Tax=Halomonas ventosae TaxID=229007 RepID=A0A4R6HYM1_9GAMM|nr:anti-virulence regulator CigR family protein [Halomonas ventosae]TDO13976.1 nickel/cobalt transporter regulator [Halomonas ventosae]
MKTRFPLYPLVAAVSLGLTLAASPLLAQPGNGHGNGQGAGSWQHQGQQSPGAKGHGKARGERPAYRDHERDEYRDRERDEYRERDRQEYHDRDTARRPSIDEREIREIFRRRREYLDHDDRDRLPPGIRMNLARGKSLPPGIAKKFDASLRRDLPDYEGYEWRRVGSDAVLVDLTNDIIYEVIHDILR